MAGPSHWARWQRLEVDGDANEAVGNLAIGRERHGWKNAEAVRRDGVGAEDVVHLETVLVVALGGVVRAAASNVRSCVSSPPVQRADIERGTQPCHERVRERHHRVRAIVGKPPPKVEKTSVRVQRDEDVLCAMAGSKDFVFPDDRCG
jgi:hypothetical protein